MAIQKTLMNISAPVLLMLTILTNSAFAQAIDKDRSANAAAMNDVQLIAANIEFNQDVMFLSQKAMDHGADSKVKEIAQEMLTDHTAMLYSIEQLGSAGTGSSNLGTQKEGSVPKQSAELNKQLSMLSGPDFDSVWIAGMQTMQQSKYDELTQLKETVRNNQLKMAFTEAIPLIRKHLSRLRIMHNTLIKNGVQQRKEAAKKLKSKPK